MTYPRPLLSALSILALTACGGDSDSTDDGSSSDTGVVTDSGSSDTGTAPEETAEIRLAHFGVFPNDEGTSVDVFVNGEASGITFGFKDTTGFVALPVGTYDFDIVPAGGTIDDSVFTVEGFSLEADAQWSIYAAGYVAAGAGSSFTVSAVQEDRASIPEGKVRIQVVHAAALGILDPVDIWAVDDACAPVSPLAEGFQFTNSGNFDLDSTAVNVGFDIGQDQTVDACFKVPDLGITDEIVSVYAVNNDAGEATLVAHLPDGTSAELQPE
ncbi:MAG: DUF4397 domain-containing protein [Myxococcota bacterium]|nr:DUF4397 domain-containing protein [Myxococcota bacterium]